MSNDDDEIVRAQLGKTGEKKPLLFLGEISGNSGGGDGHVIVRRRTYVR